MEKYGVEETDDTKTASEDGNTTCPDCGASLKNSEETGGLLICQKCGTKPFEKKQ